LTVVDLNKPSEPLSSISTDTNTSNLAAIGKDGRRERRLRIWFVVSLFSDSSEFASSGGNLVSLIAWDVVALSFWLKHS